VPRGGHTMIAASKSARTRAVEMGSVSMAHATATPASVERTVRKRSVNWIALSMVDAKTTCASAMMDGVVQIAQSVNAQTTALVTVSATTSCASAIPDSRAKTAAQLVALMTAPTTAPVTTAHASAREAGGVLTATPSDVPTIAHTPASVMRVCVIATLDSLGKIALSESAPTVAMETGFA